MSRDTAYYKETYTKWYNFREKLRTASDTALSGVKQLVEAEQYRRQKQKPIDTVLAFHDPLSKKFLALWDSILSEAGGYTASTQDWIDLIQRMGRVVRGPLPCLTDDDYKEYIA